MLLWRGINSDLRPSSEEAQRKHPPVPWPPTPTTRPGTAPLVTIASRVATVALQPSSRAGAFPIARPLPRCPSPCEVALRILIARSRRSAIPRASVATAQMWFAVRSVTPYARHLALCTPLKECGNPSENKFLRPKKHFYVRKIIFTSEKMFLRPKKHFYR